MPEERCAGCAFYIASAAAEGGAEGKCHRFPPQVTPLGQVRAVSTFPGVGEGDWCGEFTEDSLTPQVWLGR
jgi:hypothetical protein